MSLGFFSSNLSITKKLPAFIFMVWLFTCCITNNNNDKKTQMLNNLSERIIEGHKISLDTMPQPKTIQLKDIERLKVRRPTKIEVKNNKITEVDTQRILAGVPLLLNSDSLNKTPSTVRAEAKVKKAGSPGRIEAGEIYSIPENPFSFNFFTRSQGLPHDDISNVEVDDQGIFWFGTHGGGLISYNGTSFIHHNTETGLPGNNIRALYIDNEGNIWIGIRNEGVVKFDGKYFEIYTEESGLYSNNVEAIYQDYEENFWFSTSEGSITHFDGNYFTNYNESHGIPSTPITDIIKDNNENLWFTTEGNGVILFNGNSFYSYTIQQGLSSNFIQTATIDNLGKIWFGTSNNGVSVFDGESFYNFNNTTGLPCSEVLTLFSDSRNNVWIGTRNEGLIKYDGESFYNFKQSEGLYNTHITDITEDNQKRIWFGTFGSGVGQYNGDIFRHYTEYEGLNDSFIRYILKDSKKNLWLASNAKGIYIYDNNNTFYNYSLEHGLPSNNPRAMLRDKKNNIWIGFLDGSLVKFDGSDFYTITFAAEYNVFHSIVTMWEDNDGNIWIGTLNNGVFKFNGKYLINYTSEQGLVDNSISKIHGKDDSNIWISSFYGGLAKLDGQNLTIYSENEGLPNQEIFDMFFDSRGNLWAATNGNGVYYIRNNKEFFNFEEKHGLGSNFAYSIFEDKNGGLWFGTRMGLSKMLYSSSTQSSNIIKIMREEDGLAHRFGIFFKTFTEKDGFLGIGCNSRAMFEDSDGKIWIGANDILTRLDPKTGISDNVPPNIHLTNIGLFNDDIPWSGILNNQDTTLILSNGVKVKSFGFDNISSWYNLPQNLKLAYNNNYIVFNYSGTNSRFQHMIKYQYMLEGEDKNWNPFTNRAEAHYGNLPPGKYIFKIRAMNSEGIMSNELHYPFTIKHPWWRTWWAYSIYAVIAVLIMAILYKYRKIVIRRKEKRRREEWLLQQEVEVARKSVEFKQKFLANMSHEIRTPLTGLLGIAEILNKTPLNNTQKDYLQTLIHSGENLRETINMVLDYSKIEAGKYTVNEVVFSMKELLNEAEKYFVSICKKELEFKKFMDHDVPQYIKTDRNKVFQILTNLLSNAVKYTNKGKIGLHISLDKKLQSNLENENDSCFIRISVSDTGKGMSKNQQKKLFKPFYQAEQEFNRSYEGTGLGLAICKELTEMLGGTIDLVSQKDQGSTFWFTFKAKLAEDLQQIDKPHRKKPAEKLKPLKILFVEDKVVNQKVVQLMLESLGHKVSLAKNGKDAIENHRPGNYDLILMDIQMPVMDGITATKKIRKKYNDLPPIVGLSANAFEGDREKYMSMGMDEYITKPVKESDFLELLEKLDF